MRSSRADAQNRIRVGTSGWSYPSGKGTWKGIFYPAGPARRPRGAPKFDELTFYAEHFDTVEINSTFYRIPTPETAKTWADRTPKGFEFSLKLFQKFTHPEMFTKATGSDAMDLGQRDVDEFRTAIEPIADAGKLGALLAQFPASFKNDEHSRAYLEWLLERFRDYLVAVELRHRSWSDERKETTELLRGFEAAWAQIDEPKFRDSVRQDFTVDPGSFYYLRLHGRNAAQWWAHERSEDRYNYLYSEAELKPFADTIASARAQVKKLYAYLNNHFAGQAVADAAVLRHLLDEPVAAPMPAELVERYPMLEGKVTTSPPSRLL
jgi:uncharacterized protein YecE (DUF72 family)